MIASLPLAILFAAAAAFSLFEFFRHRGGGEIASYLADREAQATHVVMNGGMAAMFAPGYGPASAIGLQGLFGVAVVILLARLVLLWNRRPAGRAAGTAYHLLGLAAMLWAVRAMDAAMPAMTGMTHMMGKPSWLALALLVLFALDGLATALLAGFAPRTIMRMAEIAAERPDSGAPATAAQVRGVRLSAVPHCLMDAGMAAMLWPLAAGM